MTPREHTLPTQGASDREPWGGSEDTRATRPGLSPSRVDGPSFDQREIASSVGSRVAPPAALSHAPVAGDLLFSFTTSREILDETREQGGAEYAYAYPYRCQLGRRRRTAGSRPTSASCRVLRRVPGRRRPWAPRSGRLKRWPRWPNGAKGTPCCWHGTGRRAAGHPRGAGGRRGEQLGSRGCWSSSPAWQTIERDIGTSSVASSSRPRLQEVPLLIEVAPVLRLDAARIGEHGRPRTGNRYRGARTHCSP